MATYIDSSQIMQKVVKANGLLANQSFDQAKLDLAIDEYLDIADEMYIEAFENKSIAVADVPDYASGNMSHTAKRFITSYFYYRFFEDNFADAATDDSIYNDMMHFMSIYENLKASMTKKDFTNNIEDLFEVYPGVIPREGFQ